MELETLNYTLIAGGFGVFIVIAIMLLIKARTKDVEFIRARVFLKKDFLVNNFILILVAGTLLAAHEFIKIGIVQSVIPTGFSNFGEILETFSLLFLISWMYLWRNLLA